MAVTVARLSDGSVANCGQLVTLHGEVNQDSQLHCNRSREEILKGQSRFLLNDKVFTESGGSRGKKSFSDLVILDRIQCILYTLCIWFLRSSTDDLTPCWRSW